MYRDIVSAFARNTNDIDSNLLEIRLYDASIVGIIAFSFF